MTASVIDMPAVSVVMPLYNKERDVGRAVVSVLAQTVGDFELVVVNDGSTDGGPAVVRAIADPRVRLVEQKNAGVSAARNRGIAEARADLIAFLDADDEWMPDFLETIKRLRGRFSQCRVFATGYLFRYADQPTRSAVLRGGLPANCQEGVLEDYFSAAANSDPPLWSSAVAVDKEAIMEIGGFPIGIIAGEDLLTWARLAVRFDIAYCRRPLASFWAPIAMEDRPPRSPQSPDAVALGFIELLEAAPQGSAGGITEYLALWHRMRAVVFLKLNKGAAAREEICQAARYCRMTCRLRLLKIISVLPGTLPSRVQPFAAKVLNMFRSLIRNDS